MRDDFLKWRPHPWHGLAAGPAPPERISVFVEITPFDHVKYELDKYSGFLKIDRPQYSSSLPPAAYGFVPRTLCADRVGALMADAEDGDQDPLDVCVVASHAITHSEILLTARVVGGFPMLDDRRADDKIIAVLEGDAIYGDVRTVDELPRAILDQLGHYFATYKNIGDRPTKVRVGDPYGAEQGAAVVTAAMADYEAAYGE